MNRQALVTTVIVVVAILLVGNTAFSSNVEGKSKEIYKTHVRINFENDCWQTTVIKLNDGAFGKNLVKKKFKIGPENVKANDLRIDTTFPFNGKKVKTGVLQVIVTVRVNGGLVEEGGIVQAFSKNQQSYNFVFDGFCAP